MPLVWDVPLARSTGRIRKDPLPVHQRVASTVKQIIVPDESAFVSGHSMSIGYITAIGRDRADRRDD